MSNHHNAHPRRHFLLRSSHGLLLALAALGAQAAERPKLVVLPLVATEGASEGAALKFTNLVVEEIKSRNELELVAPPPARGSAPAPVPPPAVPAQRKVPTPEAVAAMHSGRTAFDDLRFEDAVRELRKGLEGMLQDPATADYDNVQDAYMKLAAAMFRLGLEKEAKNSLLDLVRFNPKFELPPGYPPVFQRELDKARKRLDKQPRGQISIEGASGATAFVNGRDLGMVPVLEENVPAGLHYVKVEGGKGERFGTIVEVKGGIAKVKASFGGPPPPIEPTRAPASSAADPRIAGTVDDAMKERLTQYAKAAGADFALVGVVYKTSDTQLTAGCALFQVKKTAFAALAAQTFDTDVLTANTEAFKLVDELGKKVSSFGAVASLPLHLVTKKPVAVASSSRTVVKPDAKSDKPEDVEAATPTKRGALYPTDVRPLANKSTVVDVEKPIDKSDDRPVAKPGVPVWVWIVAGVAVAAGAGVGGYFGYTAITKPVTGTVTATW